MLAAYGEQRAGVPATPQTLYNIASMAKPISAEVVMRLVAQRRIALDAPMSPLWIDPDLAADPRHQQLTPRIALTHRTGFANWRVETGGVLKFLHPPGDTFGYSGEGFEYLARFVERSTGQDFETLAQTLVFDPSGMKDTAYTRRIWFADRIAQPVDRAGKALEPRVATRFVASDDVYSTPGDYARFLLGLIAQQGVDSTLAADRSRIQVSRKAELCPPARAKVCPVDVGFGLGWEVFRFRDNTYLMHTGMDDGSFTIGYFNPATGSGTIIFTSSQNGPQLVLPILDAIGADAEFVQFLRSMAG
jgi:CubicO group peptidase (beta-lactamase class C family)